MPAERHHPHRHRVVIAGGGVAALEAMLGIRRLAEERAEIELVSPVRDFTYRPLAVAEPFGLGRVRRYDLESLADAEGARYRAEAIVEVDPEWHVAQTRSGAEIGYDALVVACGARPRESLPGALTFWGPGDEGAFGELLAALEAGSARSVAFAVPAGCSWPLPLYELALLTAAKLDERAVDGATLTIVTREPRPLEIFGPRASEELEALLADRGIEFVGSAYPASVNGRLELVPDGSIDADRVVTMPRLEGPRIKGLPHDAEGFIPVDSHGRVPDVPDVYAAGDATTFPVKQGGIAAQLADAVAETVAAWAGAPIEPAPFRPVLRGLLLTAREPRFLRNELSGAAGDRSEATRKPLWWPPGKVAGKYLAPHLAALTHEHLEPPPPEGFGSLSVEVDLTGNGVPQSGLPPGD